MRPVCNLSALTLACWQIVEMISVECDAQRDRQLRLVVGRCSKGAGLKFGAWVVSETGLWEPQWRLLKNSIMINGIHSSKAKLRLATRKMRANHRGGGAQFLQRHGEATGVIMTSAHAHLQG